MFDTSPDLLHRNLTELIFTPIAGEDAGAPLLLGCLEHPELGATQLTLSQLRWTLIGLAQCLADLGISPGDTVALIRLPKTSELPAAIVYLALSAMGVRVLYPMHLRPDALEGWLKGSHARAVLVDRQEPDRDSDGSIADRVTERARCAGVRLLTFEDDLELARRLREPPDVAPGPPPEGAAPDSECLLLTTSGSSGRAKLVRYSQSALLRCCAAWERAGLFAPELLGGRGLSLLLSHSMGLRGLWNAIWTRQPLCLVTPEWFLAHPERVSSLLLSMQPQHVTGGPATFHTLLEFARVFPQLKERCFRSLRCLVSSGAAFDSVLARRIDAAFGLPLHNAFGMTETMQVISTLVSGPHDCAPGTLGNPLPGVRIRLDGAGLGPGLARLRVASTFACNGYLGRDDWGDADGFFTTGDVVELRDNQLRYAGREQDDFINDGLGLKLSRLRLEQIYADLPPTVEGITFFPLQREPGLAALLFMPGADGAGLVTEPQILGQIQDLLEQRLERLHDEVEPLEFRHLAVGRFAVWRAAPPRTVKGNIRHAEIPDRVGPALLARLTGRYTKQPGIGRIELEQFDRSASVRIASPRLGELLRLLDLDKRYESGDGDRLRYRANGRVQEVVDFVGGYGGNLFGHRHPEVLAALEQFIAGGGVPLFDQGSARSYQGDVARRLALLVGQVTGGSYVVRFGSTGAEAVEMALAHAWLERQEAVRRLVRDQKRRFGHRAPEATREVVEEIRRRLDEVQPQVLALQGAHHGHSLGARTVTFSRKTREPFVRMSSIESRFLPLDIGLEELDATLDAQRISLPVLDEEHGRVVERTRTVSSSFAAIAEPVQGEGGVREVPLGLLRRLSGPDFPLIVDEIQSGLGRTGRLLASEGVRGDYYLLSKALGGGLVKIAVVLVDRRHYLPRFDELYASTFAGDGMSAAVTVRVLELIEALGVVERCRERGEVLTRALRKVQHDFPAVIRDVRGRGLMQAVEIDRDVTRSCFTLRMLAEQDALGAVAASYLLNRQGVRVLPTLSAPDTLRIEPSAFVDDRAIGHLAGGLRALCQALERGDSAGLLGHLVHEEELLGRGADPGPAVPDISMTVEPAATGARRVAFVLHYVFPERELAMSDPSLRSLSSVARRGLADRMMRLLRLKPTVAFARNLFDDQLWLAVILLPADVALLETLHRMDYRFLETERLQQAVDLGASLGCQCVALGGYTSILARDGTALLPPAGVKLTSGNTFTAVVGARRIVAACEVAGIDPARARLGVVGATGNIGSSLTRRLAEVHGFERVTLIGRDATKLEALARELADVADVQTSVDIAALRHCDAVAIATNTNDPLVYPEHLPPDRNVVIADVSVPSSVSRRVRSMARVHVVRLAGTVAVPGAPDLVLSSHTPPGTAFCCAAEAMLVGLEPEATSALALTGRVDPHSMDVLDRLGEEHGLFSALGEGGFKAG